MPYLVRSTINYPSVANVYTHEYVILDVDGDGDQDIILAQSRYPLENVGNPLVVLLNSGSGSFTDGTSTIFPAGAPLTIHPRGIAIADYNGDGRADLYIADHGYDAPPFPGAQNTLLLSSGAHGLVDATSQLPQVIDYSHSTATADIDGDGDADILVMNVSGGSPPSGSLTNPYFLINDGTGHFVRRDDLLPTSVSARDPGSKYTSCKFFDADGDGDQDLILGAHGGEIATNFSRIYFNDGTGRFSATSFINLPTGPWSPATAGATAITVADLDGDGRPDVILDLENNYQGHYIQLIFNRAGGFVDETIDRLPQPTTNDGHWIHSVQAVDFNGDGFVDLIARNGQYPPIFLNDGFGHFINLPGSLLDYGGWGTPEGVNLTAMDANGDGRMDLVADFLDGRMYLFTQQDPGPSQTGTANADALLGDSSDEILLGLGGDDVIFGGAGNDIISGGAGADKLVGGAGADVFKDTASNLSGDVIADFRTGDRIVITDATVGSFTYSVSGNTLTYAGGSLTLTTAPIGQLVATAAMGGGVQLTIGPPPQRAQNDFNGDGRSDILWRTSTGAIFNFLGTANGGVINNGGNSSVAVDPAYSVAGLGDFNGDGRTDILWRNPTNGVVFNFLGTASGGYSSNGDNSFVAAGTNVRVVGIGDFNGDGRADILWRNDAGTIFNFLGTASGGFTSNGANSAVNVDNAYQVAGTGDFNGDGRTDILWRNSSTGVIFNFLGTASGGFSNNGDNSYVAVGTSTQVAGIGDFDGDGRSDILWRNGAGTIFNFLGTASGGYANNGGNSSVTVDNAWHIASIADFNGDNRADILWRNDAGVIFDFLGTASGGYSNNGDNSYVALGATTTVQDPFL